jgi:hypothetical protein
MITHIDKDTYFVNADSGDEAFELFQNGYDKDGKEIELYNSEGIDTVVTKCEERKV